MPVSAPVEVSRVTPVGNVPEAIAKVNGAIPPDVEIPDETEPTLRLDKLLVRIFTTPAGLLAILPVNARTFVWLELSVTLMEKLYVWLPLLTAGVPEITPVLVSRLIPVGKVPEDTANVNGARPPLTIKG